MLRRVRRETFNARTNLLPFHPQLPRFGRDDLGHAAVLADAALKRTRLFRPTRSKSLTVGRSRRSRCHSGTFGNEYATECTTTLPESSRPSPWLRDVDPQDGPRAARVMLIPARVRLRRMMDDERIA